MYYQTKTVQRINVERIDATRNSKHNSHLFYELNVWLDRNDFLLTLFVCLVDWLVGWLVDSSSIKTCTGYWYLHIGLHMVMLVWLKNTMAWLVSLFATFNLCEKVHGNPPEHPTTRSSRHKKELEMGEGEGSYSEMFCDYVFMYMYIKVSLDSPKFELKTNPFLECYDKVSPTNTQQVVVRIALLTL